MYIYVINLAINQSPSNVFASVIAFIVINYGGNEHNFHRSSIANCQCNSCMYNYTTRIVKFCQPHCLHFV